MMKRLVLFLDGTWNKDSVDAPTNIVRLRKLLEAANRQGLCGEIEQRIYYDTGVGTHGFLDNLMGGVLGFGLSENVLQAYRFLSQFYEANQGGRDEISIFGFSRGAFTARSIAGFIAASGLLRKECCDAENLKFAWKYYRTSPKQRLPSDKARLEQLCTPGVRIAFLGVFDTVGSLGIPTGLAGNWAGSMDKFHDTKLGSAIDYAYQALAIDEHRGPFVPALWAKPDHNRNKCVEQVWFPGVHTDVGGGFGRERDLDRNLSPVSDMALRWMCSRIKASETLALADPSILKISTDAPGDPHDYYGFFYFSKFKPMYRLIGSAALRPRLRRRHNTYKLAHPEEPFLEFVHRSAFDLMVHTKGTSKRTDYVPRNVIGVIEAIESSYAAAEYDLTQDRIKIIDYDGSTMSREAASDLLKSLPKGLRN